MTRQHGDDDDTRQLVHAQDTLALLLHLGHHDDVAGLIAVVDGLSTDDLERTLIGTIGLLTSRSDLTAYVKRLGWGKRRRWFR